MNRHRRVAVFAPEDSETWLGLRSHMALKHGLIKLEEHFVNEEVVGVSRGWYSITDID